MSKVNNVMASLELKAKAKAAPAVSYDANSIEEVRAKLSGTSKTDAVASSLARKAQVNDEHVASFYEEDVVSQPSEDTEVTIRISVNGGKVSVKA